MGIPRARALGRAVACASLLGPALVGDAATSGVSMRDDDGFYYRPAYRVILAGETVEWTNDTRRGHTVTSFPGAPVEFDSSPNASGGLGASDPCSLPGIIGGAPDCIEPGESWPFTFAKPGTYLYYCKVHGRTSSAPDPSRNSGQPCGMCGTIEVQREREPDPPRQGRSSPTADPPARSTPTGRTSPTASPSPSPSPDETDAAVAAGRGGGGGARSVVALALLLALGGAGYWTWRRFLASP